MAKVSRRRVVIFSRANSIYLLGIIRAFGEDGFRLEVCHVGGGAFALSSRYIRDKYIFETPEKALDFLINDYPTLDEKPFLLTGKDNDVQLLDINRDALAKKFVLPSADGREGGLAYWLDKERQNGLAVKHGLPVPWHIVMNREDDIPKDIAYPVFTKSTISSVGGKADEAICYNEDELRQKLASCVSDRIIVMQYINKKKGVDFFGIAVKGHVYIDYCSETNRFPARFWCYGYYGHFYLAEKGDLYAKIVAMIKEINYDGPFEVEFLVDQDGKAYFMEINLRLDGDTYKMCEGVNLAAEWCRLTTLPESELPDALQLKNPDFYGMSETQDFAESLMQGKVGFWEWFREFRTCDRLMLFNSRDPVPVAVYFAQRGLIRLGFRFLRKVWRKVKGK